MYKKEQFLNDDLQLQGDSGGPAVAYDRLLGMVSFGYGCATPGSYGVYSKVAKVRTWVEQTTGIKFD